MRVSNSMTCRCVRRSRLFQMKMKMKINPMHVYLLAGVLALSGCGGGAAAEIRQRSSSSGTSARREWPEFRFWRCCCGNSDGLGGDFLK